jgi:adenylate kinase family enzyme
MKKILVIGSGGSGKSTVAIRLGKLLDIDVVHLDRLYWNPGWIETPRPEWHKIVQEILKRDSWIIDGNYSNTLALRIEACDTVVFLDRSRPLCLWRVLKRWALYRGRSRPDIAEGCPEQINLEFILWIWGYKKRTRPKVIGMLQKSSTTKNVVWLRSESEVREFLARTTNDLNH